MIAVQDPTLAAVSATGLFILVLTLFLDLLELSFARSAWFVRTLRFWLYFLLHFGLSILTAYLIWDRVPFGLIAPVATFLGVAVLSNTDIKVGGYSLVPIAQLFSTIKAKMIEQAGEDKANEVVKALLAERLQKLSSDKIERAFTAAAIAAGHNVDKALSRLQPLKQRSGERYSSVLISRLLEMNQAYAAANISEWEK